MTSIRYFAESQLHLGTIQLSLELPTPLLEKYKILHIGKSVEDGYARLTFGDDEDQVCEIPLPGCGMVEMRVDLSLDNSKDAYTIRLAAAPVTPSPSQSIMNPPLSASDLQSFRPQTIHCSSCSTILVAPPSIALSGSNGLRIHWRNLPSEYWSESVEAWMCHPSGEFTKKIEETYRAGFWPRASQVEMGAEVKDGSGASATADGIGLVGSGYILLDVGSGVDESVLRSQSGERLPPAEELGESSGTWQPLSCQCSALIGSHHFVSTRRTIKLDKHAISLRDVSGETMAYGIERFLVADMLEREAAHGTRRFLIEGEGDAAGDKGLYIWLFALDLGVTYGDTSMTEGESARAVKVLYRDIITSNTTKATDQRIERLSYDSRRLQQIRQSLNQWKAVVIGSERMGGFEVAILPL